MEKFISEMKGTKGAIILFTNASHIFGSVKVNGIDRHSDTNEQLMIMSFHLEKILRKYSNMLHVIMGNETYAMHNLHVG